jgi:hypothetical protein
MTAVRKLSGARSRSAKGGRAEGVISAATPLPLAAGAAGAAGKSRTEGACITDATAKTSAAADV